jgi:hypothetical protein
MRKLKKEAVFSGKEITSGQEWGAVPAFPILK